MLSTGWPYGHTGSDADEPAAIVAMVDGDLAGKLNECATARRFRFHSGNPE
jgi:hypothetical protein